MTDWRKLMLQDAPRHPVLEALNARVGRLRKWVDLAESKPISTPKEYFAFFDPSTCGIIQGIGMEHPTNRDLAIEYLTRQDPTNAPAKWPGEDAHLL